MGSLFGGSQKSTTQTNSGPWAAQQPYLTQAFQGAQDVYNQRAQAGPYSGEYYAPSNDIQSGGVNQAANYTSGAGSTLPNTTANTANTLQSAAPQFLGNASNLAAHGVGQTNPMLSGVLNRAAMGGMASQGTSSPLSSALEAAAMNGAGAISSGQQSLSQAAQAALSNQTQNTVNAASTYASNPAVQNAINAAISPVQQTLSEQTLPGLNRQASMGGNLNSSRAGMAEAMANQNAALDEGNIAGTIAGNAYNNGLNLAAQQGEAGINSAISAGSSLANSGANSALGVGSLQQNQNQFNTNTQLGAANSGINAQLANMGINANTMLGANAQLGSGINTGVNAGSAAGTQAEQNLALSQQAGGVLQQNQQNQDNANLYNWEQQNGGYLQNALQQEMGIVGSNNWGQSGTSTTTNTSTPSTFGTLAGLGLTGASLFAGGGPFAGTSLGSLFGGGSANGLAMAAAMSPEAMSGRGFYGPGF